MHARQQLLNAVATLLNNASNKPWRKAYVASYLPPKASLPALLVRQDAEGSVQQAFTGYRRQDRTLNLVIEAVIQTRANPEDNTATLNDYAAAIETAISLDALANPDVDHIDYSGAEPQEAPDQDGNVSISLAYTVAYSTLEGRPETLGTD